MLKGDDKTKVTTGYSWDTARERRTGRRIFLVPARTKGIVCLNIEGEYW